MELINWIAQLKDQEVIDQLMSIKSQLNRRKSKQGAKIYGSGKHLVDFVAEDFNDPLDDFDAYKN